MMIRHSNSFIISIIIHISIFIGLFIIYKQVLTGVEEEKKAPLLCIKLCNIPNKTVEPLSPTLVPSVVKKVNKKIDKPKTTPIKQIKKKKEVLVVKDVPKIDEVVVKKDRIIKEKKLPYTMPIVKPAKIVKVKVAPEKKYIDENIAKIIALLQENLYYPRRARKRGIQGEVIVRFSLSTNAEVSNIQVLSSVSDILSRGAIRTIKNIDNKLPKPKQSITFNIPISYTLH